MRFMSLTAFALAGMLNGYLVQPLAAQTAEQLTFIPAGGRTLLTDIATSKPPADELKPLLTGKHSRDEWSSYLKTHDRAIPALQRLSDKQRLTLADYLSFHMPLPGKQVPANLAATDWTRDLPKDGRDLALDNCQGCHIITVVVTQERSKTFWLGTLSTPSHAVIKFTPEQREELASYLELNAGIPIDQVPEELRASGATY
ncbi:MAG TPA: cytochrome c [Xanthobacteraceae bacterium]|nr:cytochrome c [Xanthobacteraceae bacterium]